MPAGSKVLARTMIDGVLFAAFVTLCWFLFGRRLWERAGRPAHEVAGEAAQVAVSD
jgi:hypothetical protein